MDLLLTYDKDLTTDRASKDMLGLLDDFIGVPCRVSDNAEGVSIPRLYVDGELFAIGYGQLENKLDQLVDRAEADEATG